MTMRQVLVNVFLWSGVVLVLVSCLGVLAFGNVYDRLHFTSPLNLGALLIAVAVLIHEDFSLIGNKALLIAVFLVIASPLLAHATGRAARRSELGDWRIGEAEDIEVEEKGTRCS